MEELQKPVNSKSKKHLLTISATFFILLALPVTIFLSLNSRDQRSKAEQRLPSLSLFTSPKKLYYSNQVLVKFKKEVRSTLKDGNASDTGVESLNKINKEVGAQSFGKAFSEKLAVDPKSEVGGWRKIKLEEKGEILGEDLDQARKEEMASSSAKKTFSAKTQKLAKLLEDLKKDPSVESAEPDYLSYASVFPKPQAAINRFGPIGSNDSSSLLGLAWNLTKVKADLAWQRTAGSDAIVAVIDTGVLSTHEDLVGNMWTNAEDPVNGLDDDGNGLVDDAKGWDFQNNDSDPTDDNSHGTFVSGIIGAVGDNGKGVGGLNQRIRIMPIKVLDSNGSGSSSNVANGVLYGANNGAHVINMSLGSRGDSQLLRDAVNYALGRNVVVVASAGNDNLDVSGEYPASYPGVIAVAATDQADNRASFSNYGSRIDVAAPGVDVVSTCIVGGASGYCLGSGTSFAAPHVAGEAALIKAKNPTYTQAQVVGAIKAAVDDIGSSGTDIYFGAGRINLDKAIPAEDFQSPSVSITSPRNINPPLVVSGSVNFTFNASDNSGTVSRVELYLDSNPTPIGNDTSFPFSIAWNSPGTPDGRHTFFARAYDPTSNSGSSSSIDLTVSNSDSDGDGFTDGLEQFIGTRADQTCGLKAYPPDTNGDNTVNSVDFAKIANFQNTSSGDSKYSPAYDLNGDGTINSLDLQIASSKFGRCPKSLSASWIITEIGNTSIGGRASLSGNTLTIAGSGTDIWLSADSFFYAYQSKFNDFTLTTRITTQTNSDPWAKAGIMIRDTTSVGSKYVALYVTPSHGLALQSRAATGGNATEQVSGLPFTFPNAWVRLQRSGSVFTAFSSSDGINWTKVGNPITIVMGSSVKAGLPVTSHNNSTTSGVIFDNFQITSP